MNPFCCQSYSKYEDTINIVKHIIYLDVTINNKYAIYAMKKKMDVILMEAEIVVCAAG